MKDDGRNIPVLAIEEGDDFVTLYFPNRKEMRVAGQRLFNLGIEGVSMSSQVKDFGHDDPNNPLHFHTDGDPLKKYGFNKHIHVRYDRLPTDSDKEAIFKACEACNIEVDKNLEIRKVQKVYTTLSDIFNN